MRRKGIYMARENRPRIEIDRAKETRTAEISQMIDEGGLGTRTTHYEIIKNASSKTGAITATGEALNRLVANQGVLYVKLHQYHWYVTGSDFFTLHDKFEELYNEASEHFDAFAERMIAKGEKPYSTLSEFIEHATIEEKPYTDAISSEQMVGNIISDFEKIKQVAHEGIKAADDEGDAVTEDMLIGYVEQIELTVWMLRSFLNK